MCSTVPSALLTPAASRQRPDCGFRSAPSDCGAHCWDPVPLHVHNCVTVPFTVPPSFTSRHFPNARIVPSPGNVHCCAFVPLHVHNCTFVPSAVFPPLTSTHFPPR